MILQYKIRTDFFFHLKWYIFIIVHWLEKKLTFLFISLKKSMRIIAFNKYVQVTAWYYSGLSCCTLVCGLVFHIGRQHPSSEMYHHSTGTCVEVWCAPCLFLHILGGMSKFCEQIMGKLFFCFYYTLNVLLNIIW